jgi:hypothetical protein
MAKKAAQHRSFALGNAPSCLAWQDGYQAMLPEVTHWTLNGIGWAYA